jgi:hypothetical protein
MAGPQLRGVRVLRGPQGIVQETTLPPWQMVKARMTLEDGTTPGAMRHGSIIINALIARGCRIVPDPLNRIPAEFEQFMLRLDPDDAPRLKTRKKDATLL